MTSFTVAGDETFCSKTFTPQVGSSQERKGGGEPSTVRKMHVFAELTAMVVEKRKNASHDIVAKCERGRKSEKEEKKIITQRY